MNPECFGMLTDDAVYTATISGICSYSNTHHVSLTVIRQIASQILD